MQPINADALESYCLRCHTPADETAIACGNCRTSFAGAGAFHRITAPRPSSLFVELFGSGAGSAS